MTRTSLRWNPGVAKALPGAVPSAPPWVTSIAQDAQALVSWGAPPGGGTVLSYVVTPYIAGVAQPSTTVAGTATSATITSLTNATSYTFDVLAVNQAGTARSPMSGANTPRVNLIFGDEFNGSVLDPAWSNNARDGDQSNGELQYYLPQNAQLDGVGNLVITLKPQTNNLATYNDANPPTYAGAKVTRNFTSGQVAMAWPGALAPSAFTQPGFNFTFGDVQVSAKVADGTNLWPAIWLLGANCEQTNPLDPGNVGTCGWPSVGSEEIDIAEFNNQGPNVFNAFYQFQTGSFGPTINAVTNGATTFHTYEVVWTSTSIVWKLDGTQIQTTSTSIAQTPMFLLLQIAMRGIPVINIPTMTVDFVRVFHN